MITKRPSHQRGHFDYGWLKTHHSFSFGNYRDPNHVHFRMLGIDVYNGSATQLEGFGNIAQVSFPLLQRAGGTGTSFNREDLIVVGPEGIVRFFGNIDRILP